VKALFALLAATLVLAPNAQAQTLGIAVGSKAPGAAVETLDGKPTDLAQYIGRGPVVMQFWATWCSNCKDLEPKVAAARRKYAAQGVRFVGVAVSVNQSAQRVKLYAQRHPLPLEVVYDRTGAASDAYDVPATSYVVVVDRRGTVVYTGVGSDQDIDAAVRKAL
jgi:thiol-disulfide isomerase/thioredoxin